MGDFDSIKIGVCDIHFLPLVYNETTLNGIVAIGDVSIVLTSVANVNIGDYIVVEHHIAGKEEIFRVMNKNDSTKAVVVNPRPAIGHATGAVVKILENFGLTQGGVSVRYSSKWKEIMADQYGQTIIDEALIGEGISAKVPMLETSVAKIQYAIPAATLAGNKAMIGKKPGLRLQDRATLYLLHPISSGNSVLDDVVIYRAGVANSDVELPFKVDQERVFEVEFIGIVDATKSDGSYLAAIGNSSNADFVVPTLVTAEIPIAGTTIELTFNEALDTTSTPATIDFTILGDGIQILPTLIAVAGAVVTVTVPVISTGAVVRLSYVVPPVGQIKDLAGNLTAGLSNILVTNNSTQP